MLFKEQAENWMTGLRTRKRSPVKFGSLRTYESFLSSRILPRVGNIDLSEFGNSVMKKFVGDLSSSGLSTKTQFEVISIAKQVIKSAVDSEGLQLYPRVWNDDFLDVPVVDATKQRTPIATPQQVEEALARPDGPLYAFLGGAGLRIGEALAIRYGSSESCTFWSPEKKIVSIRTAFYRRREGTPKTSSGVREVDLSTKLNDFLIQRCTSYSTGEIMFPKAQAPTGGFHAFRRRRVTDLRKAGVPEDIIKFWIGHAGQGITDRYSKLAQDIALRKDWAEKAGIGFRLPNEEKA